MDFKNVQRRVYDALNVLSALGIITKVRNRVKFVGFSHLSRHTDKQRLELPVRRPYPDFAD